MKFKNCQFAPKKRRGLSSVVGALLFVVLMVATFAVLGVALNSQTDIVSTGRDVAEIDLKKHLEDFGVSVSTNSTQFLSIDVSNVGQNPTEIFTLIITNASDITNGFPTNTYEIPSDTSFIPSGKTTDIVSTLGLQMALAPAAGDTVLYTYKVISSLGTIKTIVLECSFTKCGAVVAGGDLIVQLFADGPNGVNTKVSTIVMFVTNTASFTYTDVVPTRGFTDAPTTCNDIDPITFEPFWTLLSAGTPDVFPEGITPCDFDAIAPQDIQGGGFAIFKWDATMSGDIDSVFEFCNRVQGDDDLGVTKYSNEACDDIILIDPNDCGGCGGGDGGATIILIDDLLVRPSLFMIIPSPFGIPGQPPASQEQYKGLWGVNVANPTETPMTISKLTIVAFAPGANNLDILIDEGNDKCLPEDISPGDTFNIPKPSEPTFSGNWSCPKKNTVMWQNFTHPITVDPRSNKAFLVNIKPGSISASASLDAVIVQANIFTSSGSFGKSNYQSTMYEDGEGSLANVYLTDTNDSRDDIQSERLGIATNSTQTFKIVFADMDDDPTTAIAEGAKLIINVPREWKDVMVTNSTGFITNVTQPSVVEHGDSSTQIIAITDSPIGGTFDTVPNPDILDPVAKTITFTTEAADATKSGVKRLYIMYVLADGLTEGTPRAVGPLNEIVLQVDP